MRVENSLARSVSSIRIALTAILLLVATTVAADLPDSTRVRHPKRHTRSLGSIILRTPQYILTSPEKVVEFATRLAIEKIVEGQFGKPLIGLLSGVDRVRSFAPVAGFGSNSGIKGGMSFSIKDEELKRKSLKMKLHGSSSGRCSAPGR
ncbi:MAG: hypothetical protein ACE5FH_08835 [Candidatus Zixiibacteriota bacterium]